MALFGWTGMPVYALTSRLTRAIWVVSMFVPEAVHVGPRVQRHHDLFERGVPSALADAVDGHLNLSRTVLDRGQRVGRCQTKVIMTVCGDDDVFRTRDILPDAGDQAAEFCRRRVADGVRDVERLGAGFDRDREHLMEELGIRAAGILGRKLDVGAKAAGVLDHLAHATNALFAA